MSAVGTSSLQQATQTTHNVLVGTTRMQEKNMVMCIAGLWQLQDHPVLAVTATGHVSQKPGSKVLIQAGNI
jgi:hypothetical protein